MEALRTVKHLLSSSFRLLIPGFMLLCACASGDPKPVNEASPASSQEPITELPPVTPTPEPTEPARVLIETRFGTITIELDRDAAPQTVANFLKLAREGFYDGTTFHRVIPDFMIQGGDPNSRNADRSQHGLGGPGYTLPAEIRLRHVRGAVAMARLPDSINPQRLSSGSQFYIVIKDSPHLDGAYTVFGRVISGMEVVDTISLQPRDRNDNPIERIEMKVKVLEP